MRILLAGLDLGRGQWLLAAQALADHDAVLSSYYRAGSHMEGNLRILLAGVAGIARDAQMECGDHQGLMSYVDRGDERVHAPGWKASPRPVHLMIDSGAFSAWNSGATIEREEYLDWATAFRDRWLPQLASLAFITLDVIGDQHRTWTNTEWLWKHGLDVLPVVTRGSKMKDLERCLERPYMCVGALPAMGMKERRVVLDRIFGHILAHRDRFATFPRLHLLGCTQKWALDRYPAFSSDSSSWMSPLRAWQPSSQMKKAGLANIPRHRKDSPEHVRLTVIHTLRQEIAHVRKLEREATALWAHRGIIFADRRPPRRQGGADQRAGPEPLERERHDRGRVPRRAGVHSR